jgi:hypothetical protein
LQRPQAIVSIVERKSGYAVLKKVTKKSAELVSSAIIKGLKPISGKVKTITFDNVLLDEGNILLDNKSPSICLSKCLEDSYPDGFRRQEVVSSIANTGSINYRPNRP